MPERQSPADESMSYGCARGVARAVDAYFEKQDPKAKQQRRQKSSAVRGQIGVIRNADPLLILKELMLPLRMKRKREAARLRKQRQRERLSRSKA